MSTVTDAPRYHARYQAYLNSGSDELYPLWNDERWGDYFEETLGRRLVRGGASRDLEYNLAVLEHGAAYDEWILRRYPAPAA